MRVDTTQPSWRDSCPAVECAELAVSTTSVNLSWDCNRLGDGASPSKSLNSTTHSNLPRWFTTPNRAGGTPGIGQSAPTVRLLPLLYFPEAARLELIAAALCENSRDSWHALHKWLLIVSLDGCKPSELNQGGQKVL